MKTAKIDYEGNTKGAPLAPLVLPATAPTVDVAQVRAHPEAFPIVDIRNRAEAKIPVFDNALLIPLPELRERAHEVPTTKPGLVHCADGYCSAAGDSILQNALRGWKCWIWARPLRSFSRRWCIELPRYQV